jgi:GNAT superfamily N-acetyltransferase
VTNSGDAVELRGGRVAVLRALEPDDRDRLLEAFDRLSPASRYRRFFRSMDKMSEADLDYLTAVDHHDHEAILALDPDRDVALGVARYIRAEGDSRRAEAAVAVADDWQGVGLGRALLERLSERAREEGVERFTALVQADNRRAIEALAALGPTSTSYDDTLVELDIELGPAGLSGALAAALRAAAGSALDPRPLSERILRQARALYLGRR